MGVRLALLACSLLVLSGLVHGDEIRLRNLERLASPSVVSLDEDGLVLNAERPSGGRLVTWDEVESIQLSDAKQNETAQKLFSELGDPLFRVVTRLSTGDDEAMLEPAEKLYATFAKRRSRSSYRVLQAVVWGRIAAGRREEAVEPWLLAFETLRSRAAKLSDLPGKRRPQIDAASGLCGDLEPVWFDKDAAKRALGGVEGLISNDSPEGTSLYAASLALAAGEANKAFRWLQGDIKTEQGLAVRLALLAESEVLAGKSGPNVAEIASSFAKLPKSQEPLARYWLGRAKLLQESQREEGLLELLKIPALHGKTSPDLAAAALQEAAEYYKDDAPLAARLRAEIRRSFPTSWHAKRQNRASPAGAR